MTGIQPLPPSNGLPLLRTNAAHNRAAEQSQEKLATGLRINRGADDPAGLISSENLRAALAVLDAESRALQRGSSIASVIDGALGEMANLATRAESLVVANANSAGMSDAEREANQMELDSLLGSMNRIANSTSFNGTKLLDGSFTLQAGGNSVEIDSVTTSQLGSVETENGTYNLNDLGSGGQLQITGENLSDAGEMLKSARDQINAERGRVGSFQQAVGAQINQIGAAMESVASAESQIRDTDFARESSENLRIRSLQDIAIHVLQAANHDSRNVLNLLG
ncbi:MAG: hypothetical protein EA377_01375 [Phycisphaerales bacterium]|nr:MAG: hypothetical protein EA377_01375 [Phycisphaerales bacterium]